MSSSSAIEEATTTTVNTPPYKRVCCDQTFTSYQNFYRHRKRKHGEDISKRKQGQEEKRELIEKQRQETYQRKLEFIVMNAKKEEAKSTIVFIAEKMKMKQTPSLDLIPGLDAKTKQQLEDLDQIYSSLMKDDKDFQDVRSLAALRDKFEIEKKDLKRKMTDSMYENYHKLDGQLDFDAIGDEGFVETLGKNIQETLHDEKEKTSVYIDTLRDETKKTVEGIQKEIEALEKKVVSLKSKMKDNIQQANEKLSFFTDACTYLDLQNSEASIVEKVFDDIDKFIATKKDEATKKKRKLKDEE